MNFIRSSNKGISWEVGARDQHYAEIFAAALNVRPESFLYPDGTFIKDAALLAIERRANLKRHG